jgi:phage tail-like protein
MKRSEIEQMLPGVFQRTALEGTPLIALLEVMEALQAPDEVALDQLDAFFDPYRAPDAFVPFLASWVDLDRLLIEVPEEFEETAPPPLPSGIGRLRELVAAATFLAQWRGTAKGLLRFLETATGVQGFVIEEQVLGSDGQLKPFHLRVRVPQEAVPYQIMIERIVESEKPAYVTYELQVMDNGPGSKQGDRKGSS